jgi:type II secretory pathway pseudopilin PulG
MSTVLIVVIVVVAVLLVLGLMLTRLPKVRERARRRDAERELGERREQVVDQHREDAVPSAGIEPRGQRRAHELSGGRAE